MKKTILILLIIFVSCKNSNTKNKAENNKDVEYVDLIEDFRRNDLTKSPYDSWYLENYDNYKLDIELSLIHI